MRMAHPQRVLVSFVGKGQRANAGQQRTHTGYRTARYAFDEDYRSEPTSLFGTALIRYFHSVLEKPINRWLVLGSPQSNWDALIEAVSEENWDDDLNSIHDQVSNAVQAEEASPTSEGKGHINQALLSKWSNALSERLNGLNLECHLVGWSESSQHQMEMWRLLNDNIPARAELVLDITHGFRHQPMLLATMAVLLSSLKQLEHISFYYGALDIPKEPDVTTGSLEASRAVSQSPETAVRVLQINLFPDLLEYVRRLGVMQVAGDYFSLGKHVLREQPDLKKRLEEIAFKERANLDIPRETIETLVEQLNRWHPEDTVRQTFLPLLLEQLQKRHANTPWERMAQRADEAFKHHDYLTACTLLWEAIVSVSVLVVKPEAQSQMDNLELRKECTEALLKRLGQNPSAQTLRAFRAVRNWIVHGTPQKNQLAKKALSSPEKLRDLYKQTRSLFDEFLQRIAAV